MTARFSPLPPQSDRPVTDAPSGNGRAATASSGFAILLIDDNPAVARAVRIAFQVASHRLDIAADPEEAWSLMATTRYDAVLLDLNFTPGRTAGDEGLACLARIIADDPAACVVVVTAHSGIRVAVAAMQAGARDFVMKPWRNADLLAKVEAAIARTVRPAGDAALDVDIAVPVLLGESAAIAHVRDLVRRIGPTRAGVAITGPSGAGRMLVARAVHAASAAARQPLIAVDLRDDAQWQRLDQAEDTVILRHADRIDALAQARLLDRLPGRARAIAILDDIGALTPGLRSRIATVEIAVPSLRARADDALLLARHFARLAAARHGMPVPTMTPAAERAVTEAVWSDEVRGLALAVERAVILATGGTIDAAAFAPPLIVPPVAPASPAFALADTERSVIAAALREHRHNVTQAAAALGLSRGALYRRMERHGL